MLCLEILPPDGVDKLQVIHGPWHKSDHSLLSNQRHMAKLHSAFSKMSYDFDVALYPSMGIGGDRSGAVTKFQKRIFEDRIGVFVANNLGSKYYLPLTPWVLAHRIGHCIDATSGNLNAFKDNIATSLNAIIHLMEPNLSLTTYAIGHRFGGFYKDTIDINNRSITNILSMKSARNSMLVNEGEIFSEMVAQFLITGRVTFLQTKDWRNTLPKVFVDKREEIDNAIRISEIAINTTMKNMFDSLQGQVIAF